MIDLKKIYGLEEQQIADQIVKDHKGYLDNNCGALVQAQVNYSFLYGNHNKIATPTSGGKAILQEVYRPADLSSRQQTNYSFDKIEDAMREMVPAFMEAIPGIGIIPTTTDPIQSQNQNIQEKFIEFHKDKVWCAERLIMFDVMPNGYPGGSACLLMYPRHTGTIRVAWKDNEPYLTHTTEEGKEVPVKVNTDGTLDIGGIDVPPEQIGVEIKDKAQVLMDLKTLTVFDISISGKISRSLRDVYSATVKTVKSIGEIKKLWPEADIKEFTAAMRVEQTEHPLTGSDQYLFDVGFPKPSYGTLRGNARLVEVYQKFINPCLDFESGSVITVISLDEQSTFIDICEELPWKHPKTKKGLIPIVWFPFGMLKCGPALIQSDIQKAEGAQRGLDRVCNAAIAMAAYKAQPVIFEPYGFETLADDGTWYDKMPYPAPGTRVRYKKPTLPGLENEKPFIPLIVGDIDISAVRMFEDQLMSATHVRTNQGKSPKSISGESAQIQYTLDQRDLGPLQKAHEQAWFEIYELLIAAATTEYYKGQPFLIPEKDSYQVLEWDQEMFGDNFDYVMMSKINKPVTKKARLEVISTLVDLYAKLGNVKPELADKIGIDKIMGIMDMSEMGLSDNEKVPSLVKTKWELARMMAGHPVDNPIKEDDHDIHSASDLAEVQSVRFTTLDENIRQMIQEHLRLHLLEKSAINDLKQRQLQQQSAAQEVGRQNLQIQNQGEPQNQGM